MSADRSVDTRSLYNVAMMALAVVALSNVATRDWLGFCRMSARRLRPPEIRSAGSISHRKTGVRRIHCWGVRIRNA